MGNLDAERDELDVQMAVASEMIGSEFKSLPVSNLYLYKIYMVRMETADTTIPIKVVSGICR